MQFAGMNYLAVVLAGVTSFLFGGIWYGIFSARWMEAANIKPESIRLSSGFGVLVPYAVTLTALLIMSYVLAGLIGHLGLDQVTLRNGMISGAIVWAGFVATTLVANHTFQGAKRALTLIDGGHWLGVLLIQGAIIGAMGVR